MGRTCSVTGGLTVAKSFIMVEHCFYDITLKKQILVKSFSQDLFFTTPITHDTFAWQNPHG